MRRWWLPVLAIVMIGVCLRLGFWQLDRLAQRRAANAAIASGMAGPPMDLTEALALPDPVYRSVVATGSYDTDAGLILYGRPLEGRPGDHLLTPLVLDDGTRVLVDRGWVPIGPDGSGVVPAESAPPEGTVEVSGILLPSESGDAFGDQDPATAGLIRSINITELNARDTAGTLAPYPLLLAEQEPPQGVLPIPAPLPPPDDGPHLSYAIQWFAFALVGMVGGVVLFRRRLQPTGDQATQEPGPTANG